MDVQLPPVASNTSHNIAEWLMDIVDTGLDALGLERFKTIEEGIYLVVVIAVAFIIGWIIQKVVLFGVRRVVKMRNGVIGKELLQWKTLSKCCYIIPPLVILALTPFAFASGHHTLVIIQRVCCIYALIAFGIGLGAVFEFFFNHYNIHDNTRRLPLNGILDVVKGIMWIIITIIAVSIAVDKSPAILLTGLGAFAAALMLIFKDPILGFVAGIQMSQNDMLHVGDWIVVPGTPANGVVIDVSLTIVKVQNWDNTIITVPPYTLVSGPFQNWRGMKQSGCRQISRSIIIDITSLQKIDDARVDAIVEKYQCLKPFVDKLRKDGTVLGNNPGLNPVNGTLETNIGLFRAYCCQYLLSSPYIDNQQQIIVRLMTPTPNGLPMDIYCFTATTDWNEYEAIQSSIMEHFCTVCADFGVGVYSSATLTVTETAPESAAGTASGTVPPSQA